jgi:hypothetical protein
VITLQSAFKWNVGSGPGGVSRAYLRAHRALDNEIIKKTNNFVPARTLALSDSPAFLSEVGKIVYGTPYAVYVYYGDHMKFRTVHHTMPCARWLEASKPVWIDHWCKIVMDELMKTV